MLFIYLFYGAIKVPCPTYLCLSVPKQHKLLIKDGALCICSMNHSQRKAGEEGLST